MMMEENLRRNIPSDEATGTSRSESTSRSGCSVESGVTVDSWRCRESFATADAKLDESAGWTNEKHSSYLDDLEASFVKQLYRSIGIGCRQEEGKIQRPLSSRYLLADSYNSSDQFNVLNDGCWQRHNFEKKNALLDTSTDYHVLRNSWISHFAFSSKNPTIRTAPWENPVYHHEVNGSENASVLVVSAGNPVLDTELSRHENWVSNTAEASDQNFGDEDKLDEVSCLPASKRRKREAMVDTLNSDQVVPLGKICGRGVSNISQNI